MQGNKVEFGLVQREQHHFKGQLIGYKVKYIMGWLVKENSKVNTTSKTGARH